ncbi:Hypothetical predicted protein [Paramuricea clavata]|uniref:Uncharacterized protein n=1 Tax=Paramuricea clavata TaxID=317549 RepID=A0A7D9HL90_PARCT|nr:Hypothetical predicted protein [Paramuricea clavata]
MIGMLRKIFESADLVGYKGGNIERDLLNMLGVSCINMEIMGCPKSYCGTPLNLQALGELLENNYFDPVLWSLYSTCRYFYNKKLQDLGTREIRIRNYSSAYIYELSDESVVESKSLLWLKGDLAGIRDLMIYDKNTPNYCLVGLDCEQPIEDQIDDPRSNKTFYIIPAEWMHYIYVRFENESWAMYLAAKKFCCRQILVRGSVMIARCENISIKPEYAVVDKRCSF